VGRDYAALVRPIIPILKALSDAGVDFVVVGGVAVVLQGHPRMTIDLDLVLDLDEANVRDAMEALTQHGLTPRLPVDAASFADPAVRAGWVRDRELQVFSLHDPSDPRREVDVFAFEPIPFDELRGRARRVRIEGTEVLVASIADLIEMKRQAGRPQDLADIEALRAIARDRDERS